MKESVLSFKENTPHFCLFFTLELPQALKLLYDWPIKYYFWWFRYMITRLYNLVYFSIFHEGICGTLWLWNIDKYVVLFWVSPPLTKLSIQSDVAIHTDEYWVFEIYTTIFSHETVTLYTYYYI